MKTFKNEKTSILMGETPMSYADLAIACLNFTDPQAGVKIADMAKNIKVLEKVQQMKEKEEISLEDAEHETLVSKMNAMPWSFQHKDIISFSIAVKEAK